MQMKIVVDSPEDYKKWLKGLPTIVDEIKVASAVPATEATPATKDSATNTKTDSTLVAQAETK